MAILSVLKTFGDRLSGGLMSFPKPGITLALDFVNLGAKTLKLFEKLDSIVKTANGRIYLAKDARMPEDVFQQGYPNVDTFLRFKDSNISSLLARRLGIE
ncbi:MAG: hypothetical protein A3F18_01895 [Legionellales bacterium RIFCSPHIGHO2_12_FULL_37_14]|nr:MAG: hypothetical protein A3F18_01895 [Legionellales bacterium RIFCSPHIGHO2_12_FULL_37_14]